MRATRDRYDKARSQYNMLQRCIPLALTGMKCAWSHMAMLREAHASTPGLEFRVLLSDATDVWTTAVADYVITHKKLQAAWEELEAAELAYEQALGGLIK